MSKREFSSVVKVCIVCAKEFRARYGKQETQRTCSRACFFESRKRQVERTCERCGKTFTIYQARGDARFCSWPCRSGKVALSCHNCGTTFYVKAHEQTLRRTCSRRCQYALRIKEGRTPALGHSPSPAARQAIACGLQRYYNGDPTKHWNYRGGPGAKRGPKWDETRRLVRERDGHTCQVCGKTREQNGRNLAVHHVKPYRVFASSAEANHPDNLITCCQSCHMKLEHGTITLPAHPTS